MEPALDAACFYHRAQLILDIMHPGRELRLGIDLIRQSCENDIPGAAVSNAFVTVKTSTGIA